MTIPDYEKWETDGQRYEWKMPSAPRWKRLPIIRHIRALKLKVAVERHYSAGIGMIGIRSGYDDWVIYGVWYGLETPQ